MALLDNREHGLIPLLCIAPGPNGPWKVKQLTVGDAWIGCSGEELLPGGVIVERKEVHDLEASMIDGRYREQRTRMQAMALERGAHVAYIIEGDLSEAKRFTKEVIWKWLLRLPFVHKIPIFQTASLAETAALLQTLSVKWKDDQTDFREGKVTNYTSTIKGGASTGAKGEQRDDPRIFAISVLTCCKGISAATAEAILKACGGSLTGVWAATEQSLAVIQTSEKMKMGPAKAKKLWGLLHAPSA